MATDRLFNVPNLLTISRIPFTILLCACVAWQLWLASLLTFMAAAITDWIDGWWARRYEQGSTFGRVFDPLTDKILIGSALIFLLDVPETGLQPWMVAVVLGRELLVTGIRGYIESIGVKFGADWFGKLKTVLQSTWLIVVLLVMTLRGWSSSQRVAATLEAIHLGLLYAMVAATILSGMQYVTKAVALIGKKDGTSSAS